MEKCKTLGKETYFEFSYSGEILKIKYGFSGSKQTEIEIENTLIEDVIKRVKYPVLPEFINKFIVTVVKNKINRNFFILFCSKIILDIKNIAVIDKKIL